MESEPTYHELIRKITELERQVNQQQQLLESFLTIARMVEVDHNALCDQVLLEILGITQSQYAFYGFLDRDEQVLTLYSWSTEALGDCRVLSPALHFPIEAAGIWAEAVRKRRPIIINDYSGDHEAKKGLPEGHVGITRLFSIPIFINDRMVALAAGANKASDYTGEDIRQVEAFATGVQSILDLQKLGKELKESEEKHRLLFENAGVGIGYYDPEGRVVAYNNLAAAYMNGSPEQFVGKCFRDLFGPRSAEKYEDRLRQALASEQGQVYQDFVSLPSGKRWYLSNYHRIKNSAGQMIGVQIISLDITAQKQAEMHLESSERRLRYILKHDPNAIAVFDKDLRYVAVSDRYLVDYKVIEQDVIGKHHYEVFPEMPQAWKDVHQRVLQGMVERNDDDFFERPDGSLTYNRWECRPWYDQDGRVAGMITYTEVTTERKMAEMALKESEAILSETGRMAKIGGWEHDLTTGRGVWTEALFDIIEIESGDPPGVSEHLAYYPPLDRRILEEAYQKSVSAGVSFDLELQCLSAKGRLFWCRVTGEPVMVSGRCVKIRGTFQDITARKQAERALQESEEKYRRLFELESDAILLVRKEDGRILDANRAAVELYGYSHAELLSMKNTDLSAEPDKTSQATAEQSSAIPIRFHRHKDGTIIPVEITASHFKWQDVDVHVAAIRDITFRLEAEKEKTKLQRELYQSQKMESIGNLAGGIAHDFNNILASIIGFTELALEDVDQDSPIAENLREVFAAGTRARDLVKQILTFARQSDEAFQPIQVDTIVSELLNFIRSFIPSTIEVRSTIESEAMIMGNPTHIHQIFLNLCTNAAQAMEEHGGVLGVGLRDVLVDEQHPLAKAGLKPGSFLEATVSDTGEGMPPDIINSIFDPYFTTKAPGKGTGMGLAMVHGIVESHGGTITVDSTPGRGSTFSVYLPVGEQPPQETVLEVGQLPKGQEHILLVDDEESVVGVGQKTLERLGYRVTTRTSSEVALELFRAGPDDFDLVITDMTMPRLTGDRLAQEMMAIRPQLPVIIVTGYSTQMSEERAEEIGIKAFAMKPLVMAELARTVRRILDEAQLAMKIVDN